MTPWILLGLGAWFAGFLYATSCARGHWWSFEADACWRCERTGTDIARNG